MNDDPEILHISAREAPKDSEYRWLEVNIVFKVYAEDDTAVCEGYSDEWSHSRIYEVESPKQIDEYYLNTFNIDLLSIGSDKERKGWSYNHFCFLQRTKKPGVYRYREFVEDNAVTRAALQLLQELKDKGENTSRFVPFSTLSRSLLVLNTFWD
ncbi:MAG: hypothetical protein ACO3UU_09915 [Minisyncoccia bacterium]